MDEMPVKPSERTASPPSEREVFLAAVERPTPSERDAYLAHACAGDASLRAAVDALLRHHKDDNFLETPVVATPSRDTTLRGPSGTVLLTAVSEKPGERVGRYKLLQQIGEGGVGTVFMAEQEAPVRRRVALKVLKPGMDTKSVIARFETERQALALMDHPNIAKVFDAGTTDKGRPYFVMELVRGVRVTDFCDQQNLPTRDRLLLFIQVCHAIQHAHQKGVIHRDIKPSNILVTLHDEVPVPKVIDFGIAKAVDQRFTDKTLFTEFQAFIGTPAYMSPEQAQMSGLDIDTRTDVYSLGVLLYEMLTGKTPFDPQELLAAGLDGMRQTIRERDPVPPSTRLRTMLDAERTTTALRQQSEPAKLASVLQGDLDWIVLKALEKDRTRRYASAGDLSLDVQRFLDDEPIVARPPSAAYRFRKMVRRNKLAFAVAGAFAAALIIGLVLSTWQFIEKSNAYRRTLAAEREQSRLRMDAERARRLAETQALAARRKAYAADMNVVQQALAANNLGRAKELLETQRPAAGQIDLRGWEWRYLWQQCQSDALFTLCQGSNEVTSLSVSSDGNWVAIGDSGGQLSVWDLRARQQISSFAAGGGRVVAAFSPAAPLLAFSAPEGPGFRNRTQRVRLWNAQERRQVAELTLEGMCAGLIFSTNGATLLTIAAGDGFKFWSVPEGKPLARAPLPALPPGSPLGPAVAVTRDLQVAAYATGGELHVLDLATGRERWKATAAEENVISLAFSPEGKVLASGAGFVESAIRLWDAASGTELGRLEGHRTWVSSMVFWPDGQTLASASADQTIRLWDLSNLRRFPLRPFSPRPESADPEAARPEFPRRRRPPGPPGLPWMPNLPPVASLRGHKLEVWSLALLPDHMTLVSGSKDGSVCVWDTDPTTFHRDQTRITLPEPVRSWCFGAEGKSVLTVDAQGRVVRWQGDRLQDAEPLVELGAGLFRVLFSKDGRYLAANSTNRVVQVWDLQARRRLRDLEAPGGGVFPTGFLSATDHLVTHQFPEGTFSEWDLPTGRVVRSWPSGPAPTQEMEPGTTPPAPRSGPGPGPAALFTATFSPSAKWLFQGGDEGMGTLRNLVTGEETSFAHGLKQVSQVGFSPNEELLAVVSRTGTGGLWETATGRKVATLRGFLQAMSSVAFSPDGKRLAIGSDGNEAIKLWDVDSLQELLTLEGEGSGFHSTAFSADGNLLGSCNRRGTLHIWRPASFEEIARLEARTHSN